ncbi:MAG: peptidylprolyl isomerase [Alistipes senegalensis]|nr:peptidylprolyl isomerase [Oxalobacter formigenes]MCM1281872.1 peptidylprolyl isomerase [Alistipes senegalensis]
MTLPFFSRFSPVRFLSSRRLHACLRSLPAALFILAGSLCHAQPVPAQPAAPQVKVDTIVVVVNSDVITRRELNDRAAIIEARLKQQGVQPPRAELERQVLEHMIVESVQLQMAKERGIDVDDRQLGAMIAIIAEQNHMNMEQFEKQLEKDGTSLAAFRESVRNDITRQRLRDIEVVSKIEISDSEVDHLLGMQQANPATAQAVQSGEEIRLGHILIRIPENASPEQIAGRRSRAEHVLANLKAGGNFQQNAATYSDGDEGLNGGDMGWRSLDRLPSLFVEAVSSLKPGETTGILKSANGFHILKVLDKRRPKQEPVAPANDKPAAAGPIQQIHARHILIKVNQLVSADEARHKLLELKERLVNKAATFEELARLYSNDTSASKGGDLGWIYPGDTVPEFEKTLMSLQPGEISDPVETQFGFHLIEVLERKTEDASMERKRMAAKQALKERKIEEATEEWLRQLRDRAYVEYRLEEE